MSTTSPSYNCGNHVWKVTIFYGILSSIMSFIPLVWLYDWISSGYKTILTQPESTADDETFTAPTILPSSALPQLLTWPHEIDRLHNIRRQCCGHVLCNRDIFAWIGFASNSAPSKQVSNFSCRPTYILARNRNLINNPKD